MKCLVTLNHLARLNYQHTMFTWSGNQQLKTGVVMNKRRLRDGCTLMQKCHEENVTILSVFWAI